MMVAQTTKASTSASWCLNKCPAVALQGHCKSDACQDQQQRCRHVQEDEVSAGDLLGGPGDAGALFCNAVHVTCVGGVWGDHRLARVFSKIAGPGQISPRTIEAAVAQIEKMCSPLILQAAISIFASLDCVTMCSYSIFFFFSLPLSLSLL